jgi:hypothetical protein
MIATEMIADGRGGATHEPPPLFKVENSKQDAYSGCRFKYVFKPKTNGEL